MSANRVTGSAAPSVQKWVIDSDVENQLRSGALKKRLLDASLSHGSIELSLRCLNLTVIGWGHDEPFSTTIGWDDQQPFNKCDSSFESTSPVVPILRAFRIVRSWALLIS